VYDLDAPLSGVGGMYTVSGQTYIWSVRNLDPAVQNPARTIMLNDKTKVYTEGGPKGTVWHSIPSLQRPR
jgi:hypothetical protein